MLQVLFHAWERRLADVTKDRVVRPFEWGLEWIPENGHRTGTPAADLIGDYVSGVMADTDAFFTPPPTTDYTLTPAADGDLLTFPSALVTPHDANNTVRCRYFPAKDAKAAVLVMPQWNSDAGGHVGGRADAMHEQRLRERGVNGHARVERRVGILKHHLQVAADVVNFARGAGREIFPLEHHRAGGRREELDDGAGERGFAAAGFADEPEHLTARER